MHAGFWVRPRKPPDGSVPGTRIHDDQVAISVGFRGGLVGGGTLATVTLPAMDASFSHHWHESGAYSVRYVKPVYDREEVRVVWNESVPDASDKLKITFWVEKRDGKRVTFGWAALGAPGQKLTPPWQRSVAPLTESSDDLLPFIHMGDSQPAFECRPSDDQQIWAIARLDWAEDRNLWYRVASPWGYPVLSPVGIMDLSRQEVGPLIKLTSSKLRTIMDAGFDEVVYEPLFPHHIYRVSSRICDKGRSQHSVYWTIESIIEDETSKVVAIVRFKSRHLIREL